MAIIGNDTFVLLPGSGRDGYATVDEAKQFGVIIGYYGNTQIGLVSGYDARVVAYPGAGTAYYLAVSDKISYLTLYLIENNNYSLNSGYYINQVTTNGNYYNTGRAYSNSTTLLLPAYRVTSPDNVNSLADYIMGLSGETIPITYNAIGCTLDGPEEAEAKEEVSVIVTPESGRIIREPIQGKSISVYDKNGYIPFTYTNGILTFTVPSS